MDAVQGNGVPKWVCVEKTRGRMTHWMERCVQGDKESFSAGAMETARRYEVLKGLCQGHAWLELDRTSKQ